MNQLALDKPLAKISIGLIIGVPTTFGCLLMAAHGAILFIAGLPERDWFFILLGVLSLTGMSGFYGAWHRLVRRYPKMSNREVSFIRSLLVIGLVTGVFLAIISIAAAHSLALAAIPMALIAGGAIFLSETPARSNNAFNTDA